MYLSFSIYTRLQDVGAMDDLNELSALGFHLAQLPVDVRVGKILVYGAIFRCLDSALTIAAALTNKSPFISPFKVRIALQRSQINHFLSATLW